MFRSTLALLASTSAILISIPVLISIPARAADLLSPVQPAAPVAYVPPFSWTGFYVGGELGWIRTDPVYTTGALLLGTPFVVSAATGKDGMSYGVLAGYNYQLGSLVLGIEGDFEGWTVGKVRYTAITGDFLTAHSKWGGSVRGRVGYAADRVLLYIAGGAAFVSSVTSIPTTGISFGGDDTRVGWTVGAGLDYAFTNNWFTGVEYRYSQFQSKILHLSLPRPESWDDWIEAGPEQQPDYCSDRL
jgi:outer membrane immunogenic protein